MSGGREAGVGATLTTGAEFDEELPELEEDVPELEEDVPELEFEREETLLLLPPVLIPEGELIDDGLAALQATKVKLTAVDRNLGRIFLKKLIRIRTTYMIDVSTIPIVQSTGAQA